MENSDHAVDTVREAGLWQEDLVPLVDVITDENGPLALGDWAELPERMYVQAPSILSAYPDMHMSRWHALMCWFRRDEDLARAVVQMAHDFFGEHGRKGPDWPRERPKWTN